MKSKTHFQPALDFVFCVLCFVFCVLCFVFCVLEFVTLPTAGHS